MSNTEEHLSKPAPESVQSRFGVVRRNLRDHLGWVISILLVGLGAKLWLISRYGTPLPFWDQWSAEAVYLYLPYLKGQLTVADLFLSHNEHRIFFTRLYDLCLLMLNRQWDNQLQMVCNAVIQSAGIAGFGWLMAHLMGKRIWPFIWLPLVLALALPFAWENTLAGFQSQFYFLVILSLLAIWWLGLSPQLSVRWWLGVGTAIASVFTTGSGFLAAAAVLALTMLDILKQPRHWQRRLPMLAVCGGITVVGVLIKPDVPVHHVLQAHSVGEFLIALGNNLAWPWIVVAPFAPCNLFPLLLLGWMYFKSSETPIPGERMILGVGFWVVLQSMAAAYARGAGGNPPGWRYMDSSSFIMIANCLSILMLMIRYRQRLWFAKFWQAGFVVWGFSCVTGLWLLNDRALRIDIPEREFYQRMQLRTTRAFLATDDLRVLLNKPPPYLLRSDSPRIEAELLRNPYIRRILPACVREPLKVTPEETRDQAFIPNGCMPAGKNQPLEPWWGSCPVPGGGSRGAFESLPVQKSTLPFLEFPVGGDLGAPGLALELVDLATSQVIQVKPVQRAGEQWRSAWVKAPVGPFKIRARDESETKWFAFQQPREVGRLSRWAITMLEGWKYFLFAGFGFLLLSLASLQVRRRSVGRSER
jgi:hypothetical protein